MCMYVYVSTCKIMNMSCYLKYRTLFCVCRETPPCACVCVGLMMYMYVDVCTCKIINVCYHLQYHALLCVCCVNPRCMCVYGGRIYICMYMHAHQCVLLSTFSYSAPYMLIDPTLFACVSGE